MAALPRDAADVGTVRQQLQQKLPQLDLPAACGEEGSQPQAEWGKLEIRWETDRAWGNRCLGGKGSVQLRSWGQRERLAKEGLISKAVLAITELFHNGNTTST